MKDFNKILYLSYQISLLLNIAAVFDLRLNDYGGDWLYELLMTFYRKQFSIRESFLHNSCTSLYLNKDLFCRVREHFPII